MRNWMFVAFAAMVGFFAVGISTASAQYRPLTTCPDPCSAYNAARQQMYAPPPVQHYTPPPAVRYAAPPPVRHTYQPPPVQQARAEICVEVLNNAQDALVLYRGRTRNGAMLANFAPRWQQAHGGGWMTTICFSASLIANQQTVALCDGDGQSVWTSSNISYLLQYRRTPPGDPACTGGDGWCARRGL